jgi:hypothetical protein
MTLWHAFAKTHQKVVQSLTIVLLGHLDHPDDGYDNRDFRRYG